MSAGRAIRKTLAGSAQVAAQPTSGAIADNAMRIEARTGRSFFVSADIPDPPQRPALTLARSADESMLRGWPRNGIPVRGPRPCHASQFRQSGRQSALQTFGWLFRMKANFRIGLIAPSNGRNLRLNSTSAFGRSATVACDPNADAIGLR